MKKSTNFFNCAAKAASKTGGGDSQKNVHHLGVASEMPPRCLRDASVSIYSCQSDFSTRVWKYVACMLMVLCLGIGNVWGAEIFTFSWGSAGTAGYSYSQAGPTGGVLLSGNVIYFNSAASSSPALTTINSVKYINPHKVGFIFKPAVDVKMSITSLASNTSRTWTVNIDTIKYDQVWNAVDRAVGANKAIRNDIADSGDNTEKTWWKDHTNGKVIKESSGKLVPGTDGASLQWLSGEISPSSVTPVTNSIGIRHSATATISSYSTTNTLQTNPLQISSKDYVFKAGEIYRIYVVISSSSGVGVQSFTFTPAVTSVDLSAVAAPEGYGTVSPTSITGIASGTALSTSSNVLTVAGKGTITATPATQTAQYTYAFDSWKKSDDSALPSTITSALAVKAVFTRTARTYDVTLHTNDGTINSGNVSSYTFGVGATLPTDVSKASCDFAGWYASSTFEGERVYTIGTDATGDKEYWAKWQPAAAKHSITYAEYGEADMSAYPTEYSEGIGIASFEPLADTEDQHFLGWSPASIATTATTDQTITATWEDKKVVTFDAGLGTSVATQKVVSGTVISAPASTRTNWTLEGWTLNPSAEPVVLYDFSTAITSDMDFTAVWSRNTISGSENDIVIIDGTTINTGGTLSVVRQFANGTQNNHVKFAGGIVNTSTSSLRYITFTIPAGNTATVKEALMHSTSVFKILSSDDVTIDGEDSHATAATWDNAYFSLTGNGATQADATVATTMPAGTYYCGSYSSGLEISKLTLTVTTSPITITFKNGEATYAAITATSGEKLGNLFLNGELPSLAAATGYSFNGWKNGEDAVTKNTSISASMTINADWTATTYNVTLSAGSGASTAGAATVQMGASSLTIATATTGIGALTGFYTTADGDVKIAEADGALVAGTSYVTDGKWSYDGNITLYAQYAASYDVTYNLNGASGDAPTETAKAAGTEFTLAAAPSWDGYVFQGWKWTDATPEDHVVAAEANFTMPAYAVTFTAQWAQLYAITEDTPEHGSVDADVASAIAGATVTLTATPAEDYMFDAWDVYKTGESSTKVTVTNNQFKMPAYAVTVSASFAADTRAKILYVTSNSESDTKASDKLYDALKDTYNVKIVGPASDADQSGYDLIVLHESVGGGDNGATAIAAAKTGNTPVLNTKSYFYGADKDASKRWQWGAPNAGQSVKGATLNSAYCNIANHPLFTDVTVSEGFFEITDDAAAKCMQPVGSFSSGYEGYTLATTPNAESGNGCAIHEIPAGTTARGVSSGKYMMISVSNAKLNALNANGQKLFQNAAAYLIDGSANWTPVVVPTEASIAADPSENYTEGNTITLTASATGTTASTTYTWYRGDDWASASATTPVQAASTSGATYTKANCVEGDAGTYWCNISNGTSCDVQASVTITVSSASTPTHTITYENLKGVDVSAYPTEYTEGIGVASFAPLADITGWHFVEWSPALIGTDADEDVTITAVWTEIFEVTFDLQEHGSTIDAQDVLDGGKVTKPADPSATDWNFGGWYKEAGCTNAWDFANDVVEEDITLYAKWTADPCGSTERKSLSKVVLTATDDGTVSGYNGDEYAGDAVIGGLSSTQAAEVDDSHEGTETGYKLNNGGSAIVFATLKKGTFQEGDKVVVTITKKQDAYKVEEVGQPILDIYYGTSKDDAAFLTTIDNVTDAGSYTYRLTAADVTAIGSKKGIGVFRPSSGRTQNPYVYSVEITGCRNWTVMRTVSFDMKDHGSAIADVPVEDGEKISAPAEPEAEGYLFQGWYKETTLENEWDFANDVVEADITLYAKWVADPCSDRQSLSKLVLTAANDGTVTGYNSNEYAGEKVIAALSGTEDADIIGDATKERGYKLNSSGNSIVFATLAKGNFQEGDKVTIGITKVNDQRTVDASTAIMTIYAGSDKDHMMEVATLTGVSAPGFYTYRLTAADATAINTAGYKSIGLFRASSNGENHHVYSVEITGCRDWSASHDVTFNMHDHGSAIAAQSVYEGGKVTKPAVVEPEGWAFDGWYKESTYENLWDFDLDVMGTSDIELHAKWESEAGVIKLFDGEGNLNTTNFISAAKTTIEINEVEYPTLVAFGSNRDNLSGAKQADLVMYSATTNATKIKFELYNANGSAKSAYLWLVEEGDDAATAVASVEVPGETRITTAYYTFNGTKNRSFYLTSGSKNDIKVMQVKVMETGTAIPQFGQAGYSVSFNKGRLAAMANATVQFEGASIHSNADYAVLNNTDVKPKTYIQFENAVANTTVKIKRTSSNAYYVTNDLDNKGTSYTTDQEIVMSTTGTWYIGSVNSGSVAALSKIEFIAPKCEEPSFKALANSDICSGDPYVALDGTGTVSDGGTISYKWYAHGADESDPAAVLATTATYMPTADGSYYVVALHHVDGYTDNEATSDVVTVTTHEGTEITEGLVDLRGAIDDVVTLSVDAEGANLHYTWKECATIDGTYTDVAGAADAASLEVTVTEGMSKYYKVIVHSDCGDDLESIAHVTQFVPVVQQDVTSSIIWDWTKSASVNEIKLTTSSTPKKNEGFVMANGAATVYNNANFESDKLYLEGEYIVRDGKYFQGQMIKFNTTTAGLIRVKFSHTGNATEDKPARELYINGVATGEIRDNATAAWSGYIEVPAGEVSITAYYVDPVAKPGQQYIRVPQIEFYALDKVRDDSWIAPRELGTVCYPNGHIVIGADMYKMAGVNENGKFAFDQVDVTEPGVPYLFEATGYEPIKFYKTTAATAEEAGTSNGMVGTFVQKTLSYLTDENTYYFQGAHFYAVTDRSKDLVVPANRCYVDLNEPHPAAAPKAGVRRIVFGVNGTNSATGFENIDASEKPVKLMIDGKMYILRGEKMYDATGRLVK